MPHLPQLLDELQAALQAGDRARARQLAHRIAQAIVLAQHDLGATERRLRELQAELERPRLPTPDMPAHALSRSGAEKSAASPSATTEGIVYPVWFGTNRKPATSGSGFTAERHPRTTLGRAEVFIPESHRFGEIGNPFWKRLLRLQRQDDRLKLQAVHRHAQPGDFYAELQAEMAAVRSQDGGGEPQALVFIHGFNVSFEEAAIRAAQIGCDLKLPGATAFFSWPSRGNVSAYPADEATIEASERAIANFLIDFHGRCGAAKLHVIAHSMGNRGFLRALQRIAGDAQTRGRIRFGQIILAAPDIDRDLFCDLAHLYREHADRATLYTSRADRPVHMSSTLHDAARAGYFMPYTVAAGVDTVEVPDFDIDLMGHSYFAQAEALLHDIFDLIRHGSAPAQRQRLKAMLAPEGAMWRIVA